jgi:hypothetical protein
MKYFVLFLLLFQSGLTYSQEIKIESLYDSMIANQSIKSVRFSLTNTTPNDLWFFVNGLGYRMQIKDESGTIVEPYLRTWPEPNDLPESILIKGLESIEIEFPVNEINKTFKLRQKKVYYLYLEYYNGNKKKKTKIDTFTGKIVINPIKFILL